MLRKQGHCCSSQCGMKPMNMLSRSESTVKVRKLISSCQTLRMTKSLVIMMPYHLYWQHTKVHHLRRILGSNIYNIGKLQLCNSFAVRVSGTSLLIIIIKKHKIKTKTN